MNGLPEPDATGAVTGIALMLAVAATRTAGPVGRFQLAAAGNHGLVIDTSTGQVWSYFFSSNGGSTPAEFFSHKLNPE